MDKRYLFLQQNPHIRDMLNFDQDLAEIATASHLSVVRNMLSSVEPKGFITPEQIKYSKPTTSSEFYKMFLNMIINEVKTVEIVYDNCSSERIKEIADIAQKSFQNLNVLYPEFFIFFSSIRISVQGRRCGNNEQGKLILLLVGDTFDKIKDTILAASYVIDCLRKQGKLRYGMSDYEKAKVLYQWVVLHAKYSDNYHNDFNTFGFFFYGLSLCQAFTGAFNLLCKMEHIPAIGIPGSLIDSEKHARHLWSYIKIDDRYTYVDCTVGSPSFKNRELLWEYGVDPDKLCNWEGFDISEQDLKRTHIKQSQYFENFLKNSY